MKEQCCHLQEKAIKAHESLKRVLGTNRMGYPACFAGCYVNEENKLVINVSGDDAEAFKREVSYKLKEHVYVLQTVAYSYQALVKVANTIFATVVDGLKNTPWLKDINFWFIDTMNNQIVVYIKEMNEEKIRKFKSGIVDFPAIEFRSSGMVPRQDLGEYKNDWKYPAGAESDEYIYVHPGQAIMTDRGLATMAFRGIQFFSPLAMPEGFFTAAHAVSIGAPVHVGDTKIGWCGFRLLGLSVDSAFCPQVDYSIFPTNYLGGDMEKELEVEVQDPIIGETVNKLGAGSGLTTGKVISFDGYVVSEDIHIFGMTVNSYDSEPGDSGAVIYRYDSETNKRTIVGLNFGKATDDPALSLSSNAPAAVALNISERY